MRRVVAGDADAFARLVDRHGGRVRRLVARSVPRSAVSEVAHDAFVAAYLSLASYAETHPFEHWLVRVTLRTCADYWRARRRDALTAGDADLDSEVARAAPPVGDRELCEWVLAHLDREDREILTLVYIEELAMKECARILGWSESKAKVRAHRARVRLRRLLGRVVSDQEWRA